MRQPLHRVHQRSKVVVTGQASAPTSKLEISSSGCRLQKYLGRWVASTGAPYASVRPRSPVFNTLSMNSEDSVGLVSQYSVLSTDTVLI